MKKIYLIFCVSIFLLSCSDKRNPTIETTNINSTVVDSDDLKIIITNNDSTNYIEIGPGSEIIIDEINQDGSNKNRNHTNNVTIGDGSKIEIKSLTQKN